MLKNGSAVPLTIDETPCVLISRDAFEKLRTAPYDDSDWTDGELALLAANTFANLDRAEQIQ